MLHGFTNLLPEIYYSGAELAEFALRIIMAGIFGFVIGLERSRRNKEAGPRTHAIIACTAAALVLLSKYSFADLSNGILGTKGADPSRISSSIVSGVSFLGMGVIFRQGVNVKGLTTAAGIWATAAIGMSFGSGFYIVGIVLGLFILGMQIILHRFPMHSDLYTVQIISVTMENTDEMQNQFRKLITGHGGEIVESDLKRVGTEDITLTVHVRLHVPISFDDAQDFLQAHEGVSRLIV